MKNAVKVGIVSGLSTMGVMWGYDEFKDWKKAIKMATKSDYLVAFIFGGLVGIGGKLILSASGQDKITETFQKTPIATGLSGMIILGVADVLKDPDVK